MTIFDKIEKHFKLGTPFVVYRKPNEKVISGFFQHSKELFLVEDYSKVGFIFSPFNNQEKSVLIPENQAEFYQEKLALGSVSLQKRNTFSVDESSKEHHLQLVEKALKEIKKDRFQKVVVSRAEKQELPNFKLVESYKKLLQKYQNAFGYVWFHPNVGLWMGATPETLLDVSGARFKTMSLAGTQLSNASKTVTWQSKELKEQELVTTFITTQIKEIAVNLKTDRKETVKAGNLLHLRTKISGKLLAKKMNLKGLINALHPTPAVCGLPRLETKEFILKNENYIRTYYTGFLGELNLNDKAPDAKKSALFVNLRCMEIKDNQAVIYVGGGITKESNALKEWEETVSKSTVMKAVL